MALVGNYLVPGRLSNWCLFSDWLSTSKLLSDWSASFWKPFSVSINNIAGQDLELRRNDTWSEAAKQIQDRSNFHPDHQIIQIIRFQVCIIFEQNTPYRTADMATQLYKGPSNKE